MEDENLTEAGYLSVTDPFYSMKQTHTYIYTCTHGLTIVDYIAHDLYESVYMCACLAINPVSVQQFEKKNSVAEQSN